VESSVQVCAFVSARPPLRKRVWSARAAVGFRKGAVRRRTSCMGTGKGLQGRRWWSPALYKPAVSLANDHRVTMQKQILLGTATSETRRPLAHRRPKLARASRNREERSCAPI
jgi:hypothetical protein